MVPPEAGAGVGPVVLVGAGRVGSALARALRAAGVAVRGPLTRADLAGGPSAIAAAVAGARSVWLCVPEPALAAVAAQLPVGTLVGHPSASAPLDWLAPHARFSVHPLLPVTGAETRFEGAIAAIDGHEATTVAYARSLAVTLGLRPVHVPASQRALYHAAASMGSNFLVTLEHAAERLAAACGLPRDALVPLATAALSAWAAHGFADAITGPIARGDAATEARQRAAVAEAAPDLVPVWDALAQATHGALAQQRPR